MRLWRRRPVKLWRGQDAREAVLTVDADGLCLATAPWVPAENCVRCARPTTMRWHAYFTPDVFPVHVECARATRRELAGAPS